LLKYQPDLFYFDTGLCHDGFGVPESAKLILANYYNKSLAWNGGRLDVVANVKYPDGQEKALTRDGIMNPTWTHVSSTTTCIPRKFPARFASTRSPVAGLN
jgi:alpha-L-fucosidase